MPVIDENALIGCLLGTAVGDSVGLCCEGLSRTRLRRWYPNLDGPRFCFGRGMVSDDTEHTCMVARALTASGDDVEKFKRHLAWQFRLWLLGLPAGIGFATLRSILRLWIGFSPDKSGVFSAGNGPAMKSAVLGIRFGCDWTAMREWVRAATRLTHSDPKAEYGALAVALAASWAGRYPGTPVSGEEYAQQLQTLLGSDGRELIELIDRAVKSAQMGQPTETFANELGLTKGVTGYMYHTVPVVIQCWLRNSRNYRSGILEIIRCGGDTDTTAAILGGIIGSGTGKEGIPKEWLDKLWDYPLSVQWIESLGRTLAHTNADTEPQPVRPWLPPAYLLRNIYFLLVVLGHGFRRLFPPY